MLAQLTVSFGRYPAGMIFYVVSVVQTGPPWDRTATLACTKDDAAAGQTFDVPLANVRML